jgi:hypothetical protein
MALVDKTFAEKVLNQLDASGKLNDDVLSALPDMDANERDEFFVRAGARLGIKLEHDDPKIRSQIDSWTSQEESASSATGVTSFIRGAGKVAMFGQGDKLTSAVKTVGGEVADMLGAGTNESFGQRYDRNYAEETAKTQAGKDEYKGASLLGEITGWLLPGKQMQLLTKAGKAARGAVGLGKAGNFATRTLGVGVEAGVQAGLHEGISAGLDMDPEIAKRAGMAAGGGLIGGAAGNAALAEAAPVVLRGAAKTGKAVIYKLFGEKIDLSQASDKFMEVADNLKTTLGAEQSVASNQIAETLDTVTTQVQDALAANKPQDVVKTYEEFGQMIQGVKRTASQLYENFVSSAREANKGVQVKVAPDDRLVRNLIENGILQATDDGVNVMADALGKYGSEGRAIKDGLQKLVSKDGISWPEADALRKLVGHNADFKGDPLADVYFSLRKNLVESDVTGTVDSIFGDYHQYLSVIKPVERASKELADSGQFGKMARFFTGQVKEMSRAGTSKSGIERGVDLLSTEYGEKLFDGNSRRLITKTIHETRMNLLSSKYAESTKIQGVFKKYMNNGIEGADVKELQGLVGDVQKIYDLPKLLDQTKLPAKIKMIVKNPHNKELRQQVLDWVTKHTPESKGRVTELMDTASRLERASSLPSMKNKAFENLAEAGVSEADQRAMRYSYDFIPEFRKLADNPDILNKVDSGAIAGLSLLTDSSDILPEWVSKGLLVYSLFKISKNPTKLYNQLKGIDKNAAKTAEYISSKINGPITQLSAFGGTQTQELAK